MRILLTDDQSKRCTALKQFLEQESELSVVGEAVEATDLLMQAQETHPDLVLLDWGLPGLPATDVLSALHNLGYPLKVVAFSENREARYEALAAGADAFVSREDPQEWLLTTLRTVGGLSPCVVG
jgi:two-component system KDP operon response regulator KdpE